MKEATAYKEALRYMANAKDTLKKANKQNGIYEDVKYVRTASGTAYSAVLIALDKYLQQKEGLKFKKPKSIEEYTKRVVAQNKKLAGLLYSVYDSLHLAGYYHGTHSVKTIESGLTDALAIIKYIEE